MSDKNLDKILTDKLGDLIQQNIHGKNIAGKIGHKKYSTELHYKYLDEIILEYRKWKDSNNNLVSPLKASCKEYEAVIFERVDQYNTYRKFINQEKYALNFDSRSNLHSSSLEEFVYFLFKDVAKSFNQSAVVGKSSSFKDLFFSAESYEDLVSNPEIHLERKDHDFIIGAKMIGSFNVDGAAVGNDQRVSFDIPAIAIECKTYIDKTMLEGASRAAEQLKLVNPNAKYFIVAEYVKLADEINFNKYNIDQVYILRKQKNIDREFTFIPGNERNPIFKDVVKKLCDDVYAYLNDPWEISLSKGIERGYLIPDK